VAAVPRIVRSFLVLALLLLVSCGSDQGVLGVAEMERPLPRLDGVTLDGQQLDAASYADGRVLVINVWSETCAPCRREQPHLVSLARRLEPDGVRFLGINFLDDPDAAKAWVREFRVPYPSLHDRSGWTAARLGYPALPDTYVVDRSGTIRWVVYGQTDARELGRLIADVLPAAA
jgi:thiol-disulfide isomerase/thioredoxin